MTAELARLTIDTETDVFVVRLQARQAARALGFDATDQVRVATAVSELGRMVVAAHQPATVWIHFGDGASPALIITVRAEAAVDLEAEGSTGTGLAASRRLMDAVQITRRDPLEIRMTKTPPGGARAGLSPATLEAIRAELARHAHASPMEELRSQNLELLRTLEALKSKQEELVHLNEELQETNRGVMAMYTQLSSELEETNRGVVALYAELDERGQQLREASLAKSRFMAAVSHELRSPMNSVLALARLMLEEEPAASNSHQAFRLGLIESSAAQLLGLVNDLLDLAKAESGMLQPHLDDVDVVDLLTEVHDQLAPMVPPGVVLELEAPDRMPARTDATLLGQLIRNLASNALKFTEHGEVRVRADVSAEGVLTLSVADSGIGIDPLHQELVFEEFFQVPGPLQSRFKSTGLGLPYARRVAQALGGTLTLESQPGAGSTFTATLPLGHPAPEPLRPQMSIGTVLVVDDEEAFRHVLRGLLAGFAQRVIETQDAEGALELMQQIQPDLVLLDLRIPGGGGERVLREATSQSLARIPIVVVTSADLTAGLPPGLERAAAVVGKAELSRAVLVGAVGAARGEGPA